MTLNIKDLTTKRGDREVLVDLSFTAKDRSITLLKGANGSGKSTLLAVISGEIRAERGEITLGDLSLKDISALDQATLRAVMKQRDDFALGFTVREMLELVIRHCAKSSATRSLKALAYELDLEELLDRSLLELSGGERQRVSLAITLAREVGLYLLDEPLSAQDDQHSTRIASYLEKIARSGAIFLVATHESPELAQVASKEIHLTRS